VTVPAEPPVPRAWHEHGAPPEAMAAYAEGMCPRHGTPLHPGMFRVGGRGTMPVRWIPGGWCDQCRAWWHRPYQPGHEAGLGATWDTAGCG
jgi:hypothetical protein